MKRFALLVVAAVMSFLLVACGDNAEKKVEQTAEATVEQTDVKAADNAKADDGVKAGESQSEENNNISAPDAATVTPDEAGTVTIPATDSEKPAE